MNEETPKQLFRNPEQKPDEFLFKSILEKGTFEIMRMIIQQFSIAGIDFEWRYYKDGKAWLGKATFKNKTIVWLSVWDKFIKASFYFTEKARPTLLTLEINQDIKSEFATKEPVGKLIPLVLEIKNKEILQDFIILLNHKKNLR